MAGVWDQGRPPVWIFRARPLDLDTGIAKNLWFASTDIPTDEPFEGWLEYSSAVARVIIGGEDTTVLDQGSNTSFATAVRFRTSVEQQAILVGKGWSDVAGIQTGYFAGLSTFTVRGFIGDGSSADSTNFTTDYEDGEWHTIYLIVSSTTVSLYYDGILRDSTARSAVDLSNDFNLVFGDGRISGSAEFEGDIERVLFFEGNVSPSVIDTLMNSRDLTQEVLDNPVSALEGAWPINEGFDRFLQDVSGNGFHGHLGALNSNSFVPGWSTIVPPPGTIPGLLVSPFSVSASLVRGGSEISPHALPSFGDVELANPDGEIDKLARLSWDRRLTEHRLGLEGDLVSDYQTIWVGEAEQPNDADRETLSIGIRGVEDIYEDDFQPNRYTPGFEPYVIFDGIDNQIDFGDNINRGTVNFTIGCAFRTTVGSQGAGLYTKKDGVANNQAGYALSLGAGGTIRLDLSDGVSGFNVNEIPPGGYDAGVRIAIIGRVIQSADIAHLYWNIDGAGWVEAGNVDITGLGNIDNAVNLFVGRRGLGAFFDGEIERVAGIFGADGSNLQAMQNALDERYAGDVDASGFSHYVPLDENFGFDAADASPNGFDGTISGDSDDDDLWTGTPNGTKEIEGEPIPYFAGRSSFNQARWVDTEKLIFQISDVNFFSPDVFSVREGFVPIDLSVAHPPSGNIFNTAPEAGTYFFQSRGGFANAGNGGVFVRLGSFPTGTITWSADSTDIETNESSFYPRTIFSGALSKATGTVGSFPGAPELDAAAPYVSGISIQERQRTADVLDEILLGVDARWTVDPRNPFDANGNIQPTVLQLRDLTGETPVATYRLDPDDAPSDFDVDNFQQIGVSPVWFQVTLRYHRYRGHLTSGSEPSEISPGTRVPFRLVQELMQEWRGVTAPDNQLAKDTIRLTFKGAEARQVDSIGWFRDDAETEADRMFGLYNRQIRLFRGQLTGGLFEHWIGDVIAVEATRILSDPETGPVTKLFLVVGVDDDANESGTVLDLWGGFDLT